MIPALDPRNIDVVILCGGKGTRLKSVISDRPKPMAEIANKPFLDIIIDYVSSYGLRRFILCVGYMKEKIKEYYAPRGDSLEIVFAEEKILLGTGGAIKNAETLIKSNPFLVMNGDSFCPLNMIDFLNFHMVKKSELTVALSKIEGNGDYGVVMIDGQNRITAFNEKKSVKNAFINTGIYIFNRSIFSIIPSNTVYSLEYNLFPNFTSREFYGYITENEFIDIGTSERFKKAIRILDKANIINSLRTRKSGNE